MLNYAAYFLINNFNDIEEGSKFIVLLDWIY